MEGNLNKTVSEQQEMRDELNRQIQGIDAIKLQYKGLFDTIL